MGMPKDSPFTVGKVRKDGGKTGGRSTIPAHLVERLGKSWEQVVTSVSDDSPHPTTSLFVNSRTLMECTDPLRKGVGAPR